MRVIPVLDLMAGQVVRGVAGKRATYRPWLDSLAGCAEPRSVARALRLRFGTGELYVADLDAIAGAAPALELLSALLADGASLLVDAGLRRRADADALAPLRLPGLVAGLETLDGPHALADLLAAVSPARLIFSLDLKHGQPLAGPGWPSADPWAIAHHALTLGIQRLLVLDLAQVGTGHGPSTTDLCRRVKDGSPSIELLSGGGVRGLDDLLRLRDAGVDGVLVASALHDGRLTPDDLLTAR